MLLDEEREAAEKWCLWLAEPQAPLSGAQMPARAKGSLNAFRFGDGADEAKPPKWPLNSAREKAVAAASRAHAEPERLRAIAGLLEASPMFEWFPSVESCVKAGVAPATATSGRSTESILRTRPIAPLMWGSRGRAEPTSAPGRHPPPSAGRIPGWSGRYPRALALDAKGWAAVLWGSPRNLWRWWPP